MTYRSAVPTPTNLTIDTCIESGHEHDRTVLFALCLTAFMAALNFFATTPFFPDISEDLGVSVPVLGQVATLMILISAVAGLVVGPLADRYGFRMLLTLGVIAVGVTLVGIGLSPSLPVLFVFSVTGGLADALVFGLVFAVAGTWFQGEKRIRAIGWTSGSLSIAPVVGVPILTLIGDRSSWRTALVLGGVVAFAAAVLVWRALPSTPANGEGRFHLRQVLDAYRPILRNRPVVTIYAINLLRGMTWLAFVTYLGGYLDDRLGLETRQIGLVYMLSGIGYAIGGFVMRPKLPGRLIQVTGATAIVSAVGVFLIVVPELTWLALLVLPVASYMSSKCGIALNTMLAGMAKTGSGTIMVLNGSVFNLAAAIGALLGGIVIALGGYTLFGWVLPIFALIAGWLAFRVSRQPDFA